ncbi:MAG: hypothetical protein AB8B47_11030 [Roseobacter sp.]
MGRFLVGSFTHGVAVATGFALGVYFLPIHTALPSQVPANPEAMAQDAVYTAEFAQDLIGHYLWCWGTAEIAY